MTSIMAAAAVSASPAAIASTMRWCHNSTVSRSCGSTGPLSRNDARNAASITFPIERMNRLAEALATAICRARSASAKPTESDASRRIRSMLRCSSVMSACERRRPGFDGDTNLREIAKETLVDAGVEVPGQHIGVEHVPGAALPHHRADPRLGGEQPFCNQGLDAFPQYRPRHPKHRGEFGIAGQSHPLGVAASDDVDADAARHLRVVGVGTSRGNDHKVRCHGFAPALLAADRRARAMIACCRAMKANSRMPVTIFVHQLESVPSKVM